MKSEDGGEKNSKDSLMDAVELEIEMEKRKIREEIIAKEVTRRRELEAEVRRELMMEEQIKGSFEDNYKFGEKFMLIGSRVGDDDGDDDDDDSSLQIKNNVSGDEVGEYVALGKRPFERDPSLVAAQIAGKSVLGQVMPSLGISGMKRKAETSLATSDEETASVASKDLQKKKWYCSLCGVSATSAGGLNLHLHGKKHKAKEAMSKSGDMASSISPDSYSTENSLLPTEPTESKVLPVDEEKSQVQSVQEVKSPVQPMEEEQSQLQPMEEEKSQLQLMEEEKSQVQMMEEEKTQATKKWECSLCQLSVTSEILLKSHLQGKKHKAKEAKLGVDQGKSDNRVETAKEKSEDVKKWYCSLCQVSAMSEKNLNDHFQGKKHKAKAGLHHQEAGNVDSDSNEKITKDVKIVREKSLEGEEGFKNEQESTEPEKSQASDQEIVNTVNLVKIGLEGDEAETEELEKSGSHSQEIKSKLVKLWHCKMCNEGTYDEATMATHRKSSKHMNLLREIGGGLIVVSNVLKEAVEGEQVS